MKSFKQMLESTTSSPYHKEMIRSTLPLSDYFGINHFWYYKITFSGFYSFLGTHSAWNEFCFDQELINHFPCLRYPQILHKGVNLMKINDDPNYQEMLKVASEKFSINFSLNLISETPDGIEAFGFATKYNDLYADQRLINELPLLRSFTKYFRETNKKIFHLLENNQVNIASFLGMTFYEQPKMLAFPQKRDDFLRKIGFGQVLSLTAREKDVLKYISNGYPSSYISEQLQLQAKTVENYMATIKCKLDCNSKVELIQVAQELASTGYFD